MMKVIVIRPMYDKVSQTLGNWAKAIMSHLDVAHDLAGKSAIETNLRQSLKTDALLIGFYGHGEPNFLVGHGAGKEITTKVIHVQAPGVQPSELTNRRIYAVACHAGAGLGRSLAEAGCSFVGYDQQFAFPGGEFEEEFAKVANQALLKWATEPGTTGAQIAALLREQWYLLKREASLGSKRHLKGAFLAAVLANWNHDSVCSHEQSQR